jgi:hypothetical protein
MSTSPTPGPAPATSPESTATLSEGQRIINIFVAPTKTFTDLKARGNWSWIVPWLILLVAGYAFVGTIAQKVGFRQVTENQIRLSAKAQERMEKVPPEQRERAINVAAAITKGVSFGFPILALVFHLIVALVLWATFNVGFGAQARFATSLAVVIYSRLPELIKVVLVIVSLVAGVDPQSFNIENPVATNLGFFVDPSAHLALHRLASAVDIFSLWIVILLGIGFSCVAKVKKGAALATVFGWYAFVTLWAVGWAALFG